MSRDSGADRRRSSLKNPQVQQELRNIRGGRPMDLLNADFPGFKLPDTRLSGNSQRSVSFRPSSPTPRGSRVDRGSQFMNDPRRMAIAGASNQNLARQSAIPRSNSVSRLAALKPPTSAYRGNSTLNSTRRKSKSYESLLQTPSFSVGSRSRSKSPGMSTGRRRGATHDESAQVKTIKVVNDKRVMADMARSIYSFLDEQNCSAKPAQWNDLLKPPRMATFTVAFKFLASHFVGNDFFGAAKGDEEIAKILEVGKLLKYPGQLTKSHLKTATAPHIWPSCLTYLFWLTCRLRAMMNPPAERHIIQQFNDNDKTFEEAACESYLNLFPLHFARMLTQEHIDQELVNFKARVCDSVMHSIECSKSIDELRQEKEERLAELEKLRSEPNPAKMYQESLDAEIRVFEDLKAKTADVEKQIKQYSNINHLLLEQENLRIEIRGKVEEVNRLKQQTDKQPLSIEQALEKRQATRNLKAQLDSITAINEQLDEEIKVRTKKAETSLQELSELCREFSIVEKYNEIIRQLKLPEGLLLPSNPFGPTELEKWIENTSKTLRHADEVAKEAMKQARAVSDKTTKENMIKLKEKEDLERRIEGLKSDLSRVHKYKQFMLDKTSSELQAERAKLSTITEELNAADEKYNKAVQSQEAIASQQRELTAKLKDLKKVRDEIKDKFRKDYADLVLEVAEITAYLEALDDELADEFVNTYKRVYGINIDADPTEDNAENEDPDSKNR